MSSPSFLSVRGNMQSQKKGSRVFRLDLTNSRDFRDSPGEIFLLESLMHFDVSHRARTYRVNYIKPNWFLQQVHSNRGTLGMHEPSSADKPVDEGENRLRWEKGRDREGSSGRIDSGNV